MLPLLRRLVPCSHASYNEVDVERGTASGVTDPPDAVFEGVEQRFVAWAHQHPLVELYGWGDRSAQLLSAHLDQRAFHRLELYQDVYRLIETEDQIAFRLPGEPLIAFSLNRSRRAVTARDVEILERLRPHLSRAYLEARERRHVATVIAALESGLEESARAVVVLGRDGQDGSTDAPFTLAGERGLLHARLLDGSGIDPWRVVLLHECRAQPPSVESLRGLGLSTREAQVLRLLACGKRDGDIARELDISVGTVRKHLQHVYRKLGVDSRAQAVSRALG